ncbi:unnamed protein product [Adineta ricciae]|uniref:Uncharacterized protein n=1 Tax=Adineta ricciae TaxID=249248 RepID=A0A815SIR7_ADIRI|nr:unnamed protein product [Adineta ricciae]CAF1490663.1 unnamed protein product [Adineta ricciae]
MSSQVRTLHKRSQSSSVSKLTSEKSTFCVLRDQLRFVPRGEIISIKVLSKLSLGDMRIQGTIILIGNQEERDNLMDIVSSTKNSSKLSDTSTNDEENLAEDKGIEVIPSPKAVSSEIDECEADEEESRESEEDDDKKKKNIDLSKLSSSLSILAVNSKANIQPLTTASPTGKQTIQYLVQVGKILSNESDPCSEIDDDEIDRGEISGYICSTLDMSESELLAFNGKTLLSTARQEFRKKYPDPNTIFANATKEHIQAAAGVFLLNIDMILVGFILEFAWLNHPLEKRSNGYVKNL